MQLKITNLKSKSGIIEDLSCLFHDSYIKNYVQKKNSFKFIIFRPCYEKMIKSNWLGFIPRWNIPSIKTQIEITNIERIKQTSSDSKGGDWFIDFSIDGDKFYITGALNNYCITLKDITQIKICDVSKLCWERNYIYWGNPRVDSAQENIQKYI